MISEPDELSAADLALSATSHDLGALTRMLNDLRGRIDRGSLHRLVDVGCGYGGLTLLVARHLSIQDVTGIDAVPARLEEAARRGIHTYRVDLDREPFPIPDGQADLVTSFGVLEYLVLYDNTLSETARVLRPGGWLLLSIPNLGSYVNRLALLFGYQPREVDVSAQRFAGMPRRYGKGPIAAGIAPHLHAATLRCMQELLDFYEFDVVKTRSLAPEKGHRVIRLLDATLGRRASLSRRFILLAQRRGGDRPRLA